MPAIDSSSASKAAASSTKEDKPAKPAPSTVDANDDVDDNGPTSSPDPAPVRIITSTSPAALAAPPLTSTLVLSASTTAVVTMPSGTLSAALVAPSSGFLLIPSSALLAVAAAPSSTVASTSATPVIASSADMATADSGSGGSHTAGFVAIAILLVLAGILLPCLLRRKIRGGGKAGAGVDADPNAVVLPNGKVAIRVPRAKKVDPSAPGTASSSFVVVGEEKAETTSVCLSPQTRATWTPRAESRSWTPRSESRAWSSPGTIRAVDMPLPPALQISAPSPNPESQHASIYSSGTPVLGYTRPESTNASWFDSYHSNAAAPRS